MVKLSGLIVGTVLGSLFITVFALFLAEGNEQYSPNDYDNSTLATLNKIQDIKNDTSQLNESLMTIKQDPSFTDVIGGFFKSGYDSLKIAFRSFSVFSSMSATAADELPLGNAKSVIYDAIITIVLVLIFIGIFLAAILKWAI